MAKTLSEDLRSRLIAAVEGGMSRRAAADPLAAHRHNAEGSAQHPRGERAQRHPGRVLAQSVRR